MHKPKKRTSKSKTPNDLFRYTPERLIVALNKGGYHEDIKAIYEIIADTNSEWGKRYGTGHRNEVLSDKVARSIDPESDKDLLQRGRAVSYMLRKFGVAPALNFVGTPYLGRWFTAWHAPKVSKQDIVPLVWLWYAAAAGDLDRLLFCNTCGKWLMRRRADQEFCSVRCRRKAYRSQEVYKKKHREYMNSYNRREREWKNRYVNRNASQTVPAGRDINGQPKSGR